MTGAKYGNSAYKYGNVTRLYGQDGTNPGGAVQWIFLVDWDNNGGFNYNEASYVRDLETNRGQRYFVQPGGNGFETIQPGDGTVTLENIGRRFDPDYAAGPLYNKILPGRKFRLMVKNLTTSTVYPIMAGIIYDIPPITEVDRIVFSLRESLFILDRRISLDTLYRRPISEVIERLLVAAKWPSLFGKTLDTETQYITAFAADNINALDIIINLGDACLGQVFTDVSGKVKFYNRGHSTMSSVAIGQADCLKTIRRSQPWENLRNIVQVIANKKVRARETSIWQNSGPIAIAASSTLTFTITYSDALSPRIYSLKVNSAVDGSGFNRRSSVTYTTEYYLGRIKFVFTNAYAAIVYITELVIVGKPIVNQPMMLSATNTASVAIYGDMVFNMDNPWLQSYNHAKFFANTISDYLDAPQRTIEITIEQRPDLQYSFDLMDKIPFTAAKIFAATQDMFVGRIEHRWKDPTGQAVITTLVMRPRLTDATAVDNDPEDPGLPIIPDIPDGGPPPPPPPGGDCLTDPDAGENGPWTWVFNPEDHMPVTLLSSGRNEVSFTQYMSNKWLRKVGALHPSILEILGDWQIWNVATGNWIGETSALNWSVKIKNSFTSGIPGIILTITDSGSGVRRIQFNPSWPQEISTIVCAIDPTTDTPTLELPITPVLAVSGSKGTAEFVDGSNTKFIVSVNNSADFMSFLDGSPGAIWSVDIPTTIEHITNWRAYVKITAYNDAGGGTIQIYDIRLDKAASAGAGYTPYLWEFAETTMARFGGTPTAQTHPVIDEIQTANNVGTLDQTVTAGINYFGLVAREWNETLDSATFEITDIEYKVGGTWYSLIDIIPTYDPPHRWVIRGMAFYNICSK